jgi:hypothetical protein
MRQGPKQGITALAVTLRPMLRRLFTVLSALSLLLCAAVVALWVRSRSRTDILVHIRSGTSTMEWSCAVRGFTFCRRENVLGWLDEPEWRWETERPPLAGPRWAPDAGASSGWRVLGTSGARGTRQFSLELPEVGPTGCGFLCTTAFHEEVTVVTVPYWWAVLAASLMPGLWVARHRLPPPGLGLCPSCGYDLRATPGRCPECGSAPHEVKQRPAV